MPGIPAPEVPFQQTPKRRPISLKVVLSILIPAILLSVGGGTYWFLFQRIDSGAKTVSGLFLDSTSRTERFISSTCPSLNSQLSESKDKLSSNSIAIGFDYTIALSLSADFATQLNSDLQTWASNVLQSKIGGKVDNLEYRDLVLRDLVQEASSRCNPEESLEEIEADSRELDNQVDDIKNPGSWEPSGYYQSSEDPNIAWRWAPDYSYSCGYSTDGCIRILFTTRLKCVGDIDVTMGLLYTRNGSIQEREYESLSGVNKRQIYGLTVNHYGYEYDWWRVESISCNT
jgi:hypothetical protein